MKALFSSSGNPKRFDPDTIAAEERHRAQAIMSLPEAAERWTLAVELATTPGVTPAAAAETLRAAPVEPEEPLNPMEATYQRWRDAKEAGDERLAQQILDGEVES